MKKQITIVIFLMTTFTNCNKIMDKSYQGKNHMLKALLTVGFVLVPMVVRSSITPPPIFMDINSTTPNLLPELSPLKEIKIYLKKNVNNTNLLVSEIDKDLLERIIDDFSKKNDIIKELSKTIKKKNWIIKDQTEIIRNQINNLELTMAKTKKAEAYIKEVYSDYNYLRSNHIILLSIETGLVMSVCSGICFIYCCRVSKKKENLKEPLENNDIENNLSDPQQKIVLLNANSTIKTNV